MRKVKLNFLIFCFFCITSCNSAFKNYKELEYFVMHNEDSTLHIKPLDYFYVQIIEEYLPRKNYWGWVISSNDDSTKLTQEYYSKDIYFSGHINESKLKTGIWNGYHKDMKIFEIGYMGDNINNYPIYLGVFDQKGNYIEKTYYSIID